MYRLVGVSSLSIVKGWMRKSKDATSKHMITYLLMVIKCLYMLLHIYFKVFKGMLRKVINFPTEL